LSKKHPVYKIAAKVFVMITYLTIFLRTSRK